MSRIYRKLFISILLSAIFILLAILISLYKTNDKHSLLTSKVQEILTKKELALEELFINYSHEIDLHTFNFQNLFNPSNTHALPEDCILLVYQDSILKYWSNNAVILPDSLLKKDFTILFRYISNGWYVIKKHSVQNYILTGLIKVKNKFPYENQIIENDFRSAFGIDDNIIINTQLSEYNIYDINRTFLFSIKWREGKDITGFELDIIMLFYLTGFIFLIVALFHVSSLLHTYKIAKWLIFFGFIFDVCFVRFLVYYFEFPKIIYSSTLFSPAIFASSPLNRSLGDLLLNSLCFLGISFFIYKNVNIDLWLLGKSKSKKFIVAFTILILTLILLIGLDSMLKNLIANSTLSFHLYSITTFDKFSLIGLLSYGFLILSFFFLTMNPLRTFLPNLPTYKRGLYWIGVFLVLIGFISAFLFKNNLHVIFFLVLYLSAFLLLFRNEQKHNTISSVILFVLLFALFSTYIVHITYHRKEQESRLVFAQKLTSGRDYVAEYYFGEILTSIKKDSTLDVIVDSYFLTDTTNPDRLIEYLKRSYFSGFWSKYEILLTVCDSSKALNIQPEDYLINCYQYFDSIISENGSETASNQLFYISSEFSGDNYLGIIEFHDPHSSARIYVEIFSRFIPRGAGYPELLNDQKSKTCGSISKYSWARYDDNSLSFHFGKYSYPLNLVGNIAAETQISFFNENHYNHLYYPVANNQVLLISKKNPGLIDIIAPFSYFFLFYGFLLTFVWSILAGRDFFKLPDFSIKLKLQLFITAMTITSFLFVGIISLAFIISRNNTKNKDLLSEKAHSVLIELEHKLANESELTPDISHYLSNLLYKFSMVFFSDINIYDTEGTLVATSRPEIFTKELLSTKMDPEAFYSMAIKQNSSFIQNEAIGNYKYLSAYLPFRNEQNHLIAYLNLPYFAKQEELTSDISTFLVALINIYVILVALAVIFALVVSRYVSKPVELIKDKISRLKLGKTNEKIEWERNDEIGSLVIEYNRMVEELSKSADLLAKSERESAWREMAQQIAHEIKNPLTPMKLSVQYLHKAWDEKAPDWDQRFKRFTQTITEQIDSLSKIASEFSDFAKMPKTKFEETDLNSAIEHAINLFKYSTPVRFNFNSTGYRLIFADREQLHRVFINLINNSIQAIHVPENGIIDITIETTDNYHLIRFTDNGCGIPKEKHQRVFYPNFTTKSAGTGLGLAMVKSIIQNFQGEITFKSEEGKGTTFIIMLPVYQ
jgi:signal transduction histidine kinase